MSSRRAERLVNLVLCLLSTRQFLTADRIRAAVPGYEPDDGSARADEAFKRMFERDKSELRELGVPLETGRTSVFDVEEGYRIARRDYELPAVELEPDEAAAVGLAARLWQDAELAEAARGALLKLRAGGVDVEATRGLNMEPRVDAASEAALHPCLDAVQTGRAVRFGYRKRHSPGQQRESEPREVEPWGVVSWRGRWYLVGHDRGRDATRCFRLSRVVGTVTPVGPEGAVKVPTGIDLVAHVAATEPPEYGRVAVVRVRRGTGTWLRRICTAQRAGDGEWDVLEIGYDDPEWVADRVARQGANAVVDAPREVRDAVLRRLTAAARPADADLGRLDVMTPVETLARPRSAGG